MHGIVSRIERPRSQLKLRNSHTLCNYDVTITD